MRATGVGTQLRHAREQQGLSLGDISGRTNIASHVLEAIERDAMHQVPGGLFTRGYLRAYAREVGLDGEHVIGGYLSQVEPEPQDDVLLDQLRARYHVFDRDRRNVVQLLLLMVGVACLLYFLLIRDSSSAMAGDATPEEQWSNAPEVSSIYTPPGGGPTVA